MTNILDGNPHDVTEEDLTLPWMGGPKGLWFRCSLCGHKFEVGDYYRFIYCKGMMNIFVGPCCDNGNDEELREEWRTLNEEFRSDKFWKLRREIDHPGLFR